MLWKRFALIFVMVVAVFVVALGYFMSFVISGVTDVSIVKVLSDPQSFDGIHVQLHGHVVDVSYMFGPKYMLRDLEDGVEIALDGKSGPRNVDLEPYVSFVFDAENYTQIRNVRVSVVGYVRYIGWATDSPSFLLEVEKVEPQMGILEMIVIEFLKTTDVADGGWDGTVEIKEVYDHKLGGAVVVVGYTTVNAIHPHFAAEAIEHHTSVITINEKGEVVSAFCVWGNFHDNKIWDLINQIWIQK